MCSILVVFEIGSHSLCLYFLARLVKSLKNQVITYFFNGLVMFSVGVSGVFSCSNFINVY